MSDEDSWATGDNWERETRRIIAENVAKFNRQMDQFIEREMNIPAREPETPHKGVSLEKPEAARERMAYDSQERRDAIAKHLERAGVSPEAQLARKLLELGQGAPARDIADERRDAASRGALMRERDARGKEGPSKGIERERD